MANVYSDNMRMDEYQVSTAISEHRYWYIGSGIVLAILGLMSIVFPMAASIAGNFAIGSILILAGIMHIAHGFKTRRWMWAGVNWISGILASIVGVMLLVYPMAGLVTLTSVITVFLFASGLFKLMYAIKLKPETGWGWLAVSGGFAVLLALLVLSEWPQAAVWLLGLLIGFDLMFSGVWLFSLAISTHRARMF